MDMLYTRYSSPMDLMGRYINSGRFGTFVHEFIKADYERKQEQEEKDDDWRLWIMYVHSYSDKTFNDWKRDILTPGPTKAGKNKDNDLTDDGIKTIIGHLFPSQTSPGT